MKRLENILVAIIAIPYVAFLCLKLAWEWFKFSWGMARPDDKE